MTCCFCFLSYNDIGLLPLVEIVLEEGVWDLAVWPQ